MGEASLDRRRVGRAPLLALLLACLFSVAGAILPPAAPSVPMLAALDAPVALAAGDLDIATETRYVVVPDKAVVRVSVDVRVENQKPNRVNGGLITRYFYDGVNLGVQSEATRFRATQGGSSLKVTSTKREGFRLVTVSFRSNLYYQESTRFRLQFDLPAGKPRSASDVRVGAAFATFLAWAFGDHGTIRVEVPVPFRVSISGSEMAREPAGDGVQAWTASTSNALGWYAWINASNDDGLTREQLDLDGGEKIVIRGWPEDTRWRRRVGAILTDSVPDLVARIGLPWPVDGPLDVFEVHTPLLEGYAGFYDRSSDEITISEDLDDFTIVHEASHAWFNGDLFTERWISEGLADEYASRVLRDEGRDGADPEPVKRDSKVAFPLSTWPPPAPIRDKESDAREQYGYDAAWTLIRSVVEGAGEEGMRLVFRAAAGRTTAYPGNGAPEKASLPNDWRRFLDLTEEIGGATGVADLMATWVVTEDSTAVLEARETARAAYHRLVDAGDGWAAPLVVRVAMERWSFDDAGPMIENAEAILEQRDTTADLAAAEGLKPPDDLETAYEDATSASALTQAADLANQTQTSLGAIAAAGDAVAAPRDWLVDLGLSGKDPDGDLAAARSAWEAGDLAAATDRATLVSGTLAVAAEAGRGRALVIGGVVALIVLLVLVIALLLWRRARRRRLPIAPALAGGAPAGSADTAVAFDAPPAPGALTTAPTSGDAAAVPDDDAPTEILGPRSPGWSEPSPPPSPTEPPGGGVEP